MINFKKVVSMVVMLSLILGACGKSPARRGDDSVVQTNGENRTGVGHEKVGAADSENLGDSEKNEPTKFGKWLSWVTPWGDKNDTVGKWWHRVDNFGMFLGAAGMMGALVIVTRLWPRSGKSLSTTGTILKCGARYTGYVVSVAAAAISVGSAVGSARKVGYGTGWMLGYGVLAGFAGLAIFGTAATLIRYVTTTAVVGTGGPAPEPNGPNDQNQNNDPVQEPVPADPNAPNPQVDDPNAKPVAPTDDPTYAPTDDPKEKEKGKEKEKEKEKGKEKENAAKAKSETAEKEKEAKEGEERETAKRKQELLDEKRLERNKKLQELLDEKRQERQKQTQERQKQTQERQAAMQARQQRGEREPIEILIECGYRNMQQEQALRGIQEREQARQVEDEAIYEARERLDENKNVLAQLAKIDDDWGTFENQKALILADIAITDDLADAFWEYHDTKVVEQVTHIENLSKEMVKNEREEHLDNAETVMKEAQMAAEIAKIHMMWEEEDLNNLSIALTKEKEMLKGEGKNTEAKVMVERRMWVEWQNVILAAQRKKADIIIELVEDWLLVNNRSDRNQRKNLGLKW